VSITGGALAAHALHFTGSPGPTANDIVIQGQDTRAEALSQRIARREVARPIGVVVGKVVNSFVIFGERQNADVERLFVLPSGPGFYRSGAPRIDQGGHDIRVEQPAPQSSTSRP
jgi:hypothetical protein